MGAIVAGNAFPADKHVVWLNIQKGEIISEEKKDKTSVNEWQSL